MKNTLVVLLLIASPILLGTWLYLSNPQQDIDPEMEPPLNINGHGFTVKNQPGSECQQAGGKLIEITECNGDKSDYCYFSDRIHCYADLVKDGQCQVEFSEDWYQSTGYGMIGPGSGPKVLCD